MSSVESQIAPQDLQAFSAFLSSKKIVIADPNKTARATIARALTDLGAKTTDIALSPSYPDALQAIRSSKPDLVFADYHLENRCGLELTPEHRKARPDLEHTLFVLVTGNASESAVAEAAEGDVDAYVLKPFSMDSLKLHIVQAGIDKIKPSGYRGALSRGKDLLHQGRAADAIALFREAKGMSPKPSMACYYEGQGHEQQKELAQSEQSYQEGLSFNEMHYRCSIALFDLLVNRADLSGAYGVIRKVSNVFPISPQRLCKTIDLAVRTQQFEDIDRYYDVFVKLDERREDLKKYVCAALVVGAMYQLRHKSIDRAVDLLRKAAVTSADQPSVLKEAILVLVEHGGAEQAKAFLKRFPADTQKSTFYLSSEYAILDKTSPLEEVLVRGRSLVQGGIQDPLIYKILIRRTVEAGFPETADQLVQEAAIIWPSQTEAFKSLAKRPQ